MLHLSQNICFKPCWKQQVNYNSFCANNWRENIKNDDCPFIFNRFLLRAPQPSEAPPLLARIASNGHREICG